MSKRRSEVPGAHKGATQQPHFPKVTSTPPQPRTKESVAAHGWVWLAHEAVHSNDPYFRNWMRDEAYTLLSRLEPLPRPVRTG